MEGQARYLGMGSWSHATILALLGDVGVTFGSELCKDVWVVGEVLRPLGLEGILVCVLLG